MVRPFSCPARAEFQNVQVVRGEPEMSVGPSSGRADGRKWYLGRTMRVHIIVASLAFLIVGHARGTVVDAGTDAQRDCQLFVEGSFRDNDDARSAGSCEGMVEAAMLFSPNLPPDVRACPPAQGSILESAKVLLRYLDQNPDRLNEAGITLAFEAFREAWPCLGDDAESTEGSKPRPKKRVPKKSK